MPKTDSFITVGSTWELESYRYQNLATSAKTYERQQESSSVKVKRILPEYTYTLGEGALDIEVVDQSMSGQSGCSVLVLGKQLLAIYGWGCYVCFFQRCIIESITIKILDYVIVFIIVLVIVLLLNFFL